MRVQSLPSGRIDVLIAEDDAPVRSPCAGCWSKKAIAVSKRRTAGKRSIWRWRCRRNAFCSISPYRSWTVSASLVELRSDPRTASAHIHCLTGLVDDTIRERAYQAGCEQFLTKPLDPSQLLAVVAEQVRRTEVASVSELTARQAEDLLDWLEDQGCTNLEVTLDEDSFTVRCDCPPGLRLAQEDDGEVHLFRIERGGLVF